MKNILNGHNYDKIVGSFTNSVEVKFDIIGSQSVHEKS